MSINEKKEQERDCDFTAEVEEQQSVRAKKLFYIDWIPEYKDTALDICNTKAKLLEFETLRRNSSAQCSRMIEALRLINCRNLTDGTLEDIISSKVHFYGHSHCGLFSSC